MLSIDGDEPPREDPGMLTGQSAAGDSDENERLRPSCQNNNDHRRLTGLLRKRITNTYS